MNRASTGLIALLVAVQPCAAEWTTTQKSGAATLEVRYESQDGVLPILALADLITVTLTVEGSAALETPIAPLELPAKAPWVLVERTRPTRKVMTGDRRQWQITYRFAPRELGEAVAFTFPDVKFKDGEQHTASWLPITFVVTTKVASTDLSELKDITAVEEVHIAEESTAWWQVGSLIGAACVLILAVGAWVHAYLQRKQTRSNAWIALYELQRLTALNLPEQGRSERFITLLTTLVRRYLERQYAIPARRQTTPEFLRDLAEHNALTAEQKHFLGRFLERCEAVKFADMEMSAEECGEWTEQAKRFLQSSLAA